MIIEKIKINNFRQYRDQEINLSTPDDEKNFNIIQGTNGAGKTNLFNAITWCLYGKEIHRPIKYSGLPLLNNFKSESMDDGDTDIVKVEINMKKDNDLIIFRRSLGFKKDNGKIKKMKEFSYDSADGSLLEMFRQKNNDMQISSDPEISVTRMIPENIKEYFFFDGEKLNNYFGNNSGEKIHDAVFKISQLNLFENLIGHLENRKKHFRKKLNKVSPEAENLGNKVEVLEKSLESYKEDFQNIKWERVAAEEREEEYRKKLENTSISLVKELQKQRNIHEKNLERFERDIDEKTSERDDFVLRMTPSIFTFEALKETRLKIKEKGETGQIPPDYKKEFLERLISDNLCICGTKLSENDDCKDHLENLLQSCSDITNISSDLILENKEIGIIISNLKNFSEKIAAYEKKIHDINELRRSSSIKLKETNEKIEGIDSEKIEEWNKEYHRYQKMVKELTRREIEHSVKIKETETIIRRTSKKLEGEIKKKAEQKSLTIIKNFCEESLEAAKSIKDEIMTEIRLDVEKKTEEQFFNLIWKKKTYTSVNIDEDYNVSVLDQFGAQARGTLSAGETQVLALSFMAALNTVSGFDAPIIIDTPLGKLGKEPKLNIAQNLPGYLKGKQVTMLVTEEEYTKEVREALAPRVGAEYKIMFNDSEKGSESMVVPYE
ncbi:MAG: AAA family ATPase [Methanobacteriaceae archaeon]|nr:AAA family ATPase [Methanobacteriaceae archaeon]